jgi:hypothetical protein
MPEQDLKIEYVETAELIIHPDNPRKGDVGAIAESVTTNGVYKPLVVSRDSMHVIAGNHTLMALRQLGHETAAVVYLDNLTLEEEARILAADNKLGDKATYDDDKLLALLHQFDDLTGTGYTDAELDDLELLLESSADATARMFEAAGTDAHRNETDDEQEARAERLSQQQSLTGQGLQEMILVLPTAKREQALAWIDALRHAWGDQLTNGEVVYAALARITEKV